MCGRYALFGPRSRARREIEDKYFGELSGIAPRYNVAPDQGSAKREPLKIPIVRMDKEGLETAWVQWWLLPWWSKERYLKYSTFNARIETVAKTPAFREPFKLRRCLVPANGYFEWQKLPDRKQPWFVYPRQGNYFAFAGLWDRWKHGDQVVESCTILVADPVAEIEEIHDRMPVILAPDLWDEWLDPKLDDPEKLLQLLHANPGDPMDRHKVSAAVSNSRNEGPELIEALY